MATKATNWSDNYPVTNYPNGFDVTCVIGRVELDGNGDFTPHEAAFLMIARHDARGTFNFPMQDGRTMSVTVDYPDYE